MSKKHFIVIARTIKEAQIDTHARFVIAQELADEFAKFNPLFDYTRFMEACGVRS